MLEHVLKQIDSTQGQSLEALKQLLRIPSVSAKSEHADDVRRCAQFLADRLSRMGLTARVQSTAKHPAVIARSPHRPGRATVLLYGHYDVQPAEPLHLWTSPAFEPTVRDGAVFARGACDDKGQIWTHLQAIEAWQQHGGLPVNLNILFEGEEEIGSPNLQSLMEQFRSELAADVAIISDTGQFDRGVPAITYGLRGLVYEEVFLTGPGHDLHSGIFGGAVPNPANVLAQMLASLHDAQGRVTIPGFYDDVVPLSDSERQMWRKLPFDEPRYLQNLKLSASFGEEGYSILERVWARPTCDVNGLTSGYQGEGAKTIIPSTASAKVSMRLVPNQDPAKIREAFEQHLRRLCPPMMQIRFECHGASPGVIVPLDGRPMQRAGEAVQIGFGTAPSFIREGGSIPVVGLIKRLLNIDTLLVGFGLPDDRIHSPNEKFDLDALHKGTRTAAALYERLGAL